MTTHALMELANCPFCDGPADFVMQTPRKWSVNCMHNACVEMGMSEDKKELAKLWNTRPALRTAAAEGGQFEHWDLFRWLLTKNGFSSVSDGREAYVAELIRTAQGHPPTDSGAGRDGERYRWLVTTWGVTYPLSAAVVRVLEAFKDGDKAKIDTAIDTAIAGAAGECG